MNRRGPATRLSIDVGTSNTVAVLSMPGRQPRVLDVDGAAGMPSAVFAAADGRLVAGREAVRLARLAPARFEPHPKRRVDEGTLLLGDAVVPVAAALAAVIGKVVAEASRQLGGAWPDQVLLTHPAQWGSARCGVLLAAAQQAGLGGRVVLVPEPVAAAAHFAAVTGHSPRQATAVYDLGAGTFDVAVVGSGPGGLTVLADAGLPDLGGLDADQALLDHLGRQVAGQDPDGWERLVDPRSPEDRLAAMALRQDIRLAKEALSEHPQTEVMLPAPFGVVLVTRAELENLIEPGLRRSTELLATTARGAGLAVGWLGAVYLVGGSSRIPLVARLIAEQFGVVPVALDQPETVVAFGAHLAVPRPPAGTVPKRKWRAAALVGALAVVLVAALVAVIVVQPWRDGPTSSSAPSQTGGPNGKGGFHWSLTRGETGFFTGLWTTPKGVVLGTDAGLTAYDVETGATIWSWRAPKDNYLCNMSQSTANGIGAVTYGPWNSDGGEDCHYLQTIELDSGDPHWKDPVKLVADGYSGWLGKIGGTSLSISDKLVTAAYAGENAQAEHSTDLLWVDVSTGKRLGATDAGAGEVDIGCRLTGHAQALRDQVIAVVTCPAFPNPMLLRWRTDGEVWTPDGQLEGCGEISNILVTGFMYAEGDNLLVGCGGATRLDQLYMVTYNSYSTSAADLDGVAVDTVDVGSAGGDLKNVLMSGENFYLVKGADGKSDGVVASKVSYSQSWQYVLSGATEVSLMAAAGEAVTVLVTTPGPAALYTVSGPNRSTKGPGLPPDVADMLPNARQAVRVGDYLVCGFNGLEDDETVIGVVRAQA